MAKRRNGKSKMPKIGSLKNRLYPFVKTVSAPIAFLEQITAKDRQDLGQSFSTAGYSTQLKIMSNIVMGRLAGITPFHKLSDGTMLPTAPQTINPAGVVNKWTNAGLIGLGYKVIGSQINKTTGMSLIPETSKIGSIGKSVLIGGALGGFFDDAPAKAQTFTRQSFPTTTNRALTTTYNSGQDSTGSSF
tara:strand:+ start:440 stop:1006 length:567 start_codon:yes stop_codon:yes gene_type:complete